MYRPNRRRRSAPRILGLALVAAAYLAALAWASDIDAADAASSVRDVATTAGSAASTRVTAATSATAEAMGGALHGVPHEAPLVTLAIAGGLLLVGGSWYLLGALRRRRSVARRARLVVRYLTALI